MFRPKCSRWVEGSKDLRCVADVQDAPCSNNQMPVCQTAYFGLVKPPAEETRCFCSDPARTFIAMYLNEGGRQVRVFITSFIFRSWSRQQIEQKGCLTSCWQDSIASKMAFELAGPINSLLPLDPLYSSTHISPSYPLEISRTREALAVKTAAVSLSGPRRRRTLLMSWSELWRCRDSILKDLRVWLCPGVRFPKAVMLVTNIV